MKKIAIIGFGVVGSGVYEIVRQNKDILTKKAGEEIDVKRILDIRDFGNHEEAHLFTKDFNDLLNRIYPKPVPKKPSFSQKAISFIKRGVKKVLCIIKKK